MSNQKLKTECQNLIWIKGIGNLKQVTLQMTCCGTSIDIVATKLEGDMPRILDWFKINSMVVNASKFQVVFLGIEGKHNLCLDIEGSRVKSTKEVKLLGVIIDSKLNFNSHVGNLCKKANHKISALARVRNYISPVKSRLLYNAYILSPFRYFPLIWTFTNKTKNICMQQIQKRALRIIQGNFNLTLEECLHDTGSISIHTQNLKYLMVEVYKCLHHVNPEFMWELFIPKVIPYNLRKSNLLTLPKIKSSSYGIDSLLFRGSILWNTIPDYIKSSNSLSAFKLKIKNWKGELCNCRICCR